MKMHRKGKNKTFGYYILFFYLIASNCARQVTGSRLSNVPRVEDFISYFWN